MVSAAELIAIRDAAGPVAVGLPLNELLMSRWSREDATAYFESGGLFAPASWEPNGYRAPKSEWKSTGSFASSPKASAPAPPISIPVQPKPPEGNWSGAPLLVCWHGAGNDRAMSQQLLAPLLSEAAKAGITEQLVLFNPHEYSTLTMWSEYINRMLRDIDARSKDSPLLLVGFSSGTAPAFAVAHRLGKRVLQVCVVGMRPVFNVSEQAPAHAEEVFGVPSPAEFKALTDEAKLEGIASAWVPALKPFCGLPPNKWTPGVQAIVTQFSKLYGLRHYPGYSTNWSRAFGPSPPSLSVPLVAVAGGSEEPKGERPEKMAGWAAMTSAAFESHTVEGATHMSLLSDDPAMGSSAVALIVEKLKAARDAR